MLNVQAQVKARFAQLAIEAANLPMLGSGEHVYAQVQPFYAWASSALNVIQAVFEKTSPHYEHLNAEIENIRNNFVPDTVVDACRGIFLGAKSDIDSGLVLDLESAFTGEVFADFISAAKAALIEGQHTVATVLACAALEDALKRFATRNGLEVDGKAMDEVVNALKTSGLVGGTQKGLLTVLPKIRNHAMHAEWEKLTPQDAGGVIGFVEQFLSNHFG